MWKFSIRSVPVNLVIIFHWKQLFRRFTMETGCTQYFVPCMLYPVLCTMYSVPTLYPVSHTRWQIFRRPHTAGCPSTWAGRPRRPRRAAPVRHSWRWSGGLSEIWSHELTFHICVYSWEGWTSDQFRIQHYIKFYHIHFYIFICLWSVWVQLIKGDISLPKVVLGPGLVISH